MSKLKRSTEQLYKMFSPYRVGNDFVGCECCVAPSESAKLTSKPLRLLTYDDLEHYSSSAMSTWGDVRHFKHFLPRLLELAIEHRDEFLDLAVVFGKLAYARWYSWPPREIDAVDGFLRAYWEYQLTIDIDSPQDDAIDTVLCAEACACESVKPLLTAWLEEESISAKKHLAAFVLGNNDYLLRKQRLANAFWDYRAKPHDEVICWLRSSAVSTYLSNAELPQEFELARCQLDTIRSALGEIPT
jgi:hypothetical protein